MTNEEHNTALYQKMFAEQEKFRDWLKGQPPEEVLNHAYEYTIREDILMSLEYHNLSDAQADALMKFPSPLADVFRDFEKRETDHMDVIWDCLESRADMLLEEQRRALRETPVYPFPASYAQEHGELEQYRASNRANAACKEAIEAAIREHYDGNSLDSQAAELVVEAFGLDRTLYVLANTVQQKDWDGRISSGNKAWAKTIPIHKNPDMKLIFKILTAPVTLAIDLFSLICIGIISCSAMLLRLVSGIIGILGIAVLVTYSPKNGLILLTIAFLFSPMGLPMIAVWILSVLQGMKGMLKSI